MKRINLGSGDDLREGYINVDLYEPTADIKHDLNSIPYPFSDNFADEILMQHVLEHCDKPIDVVNECIRILKPSGKLIVEVPMYNHAAAIEAAHTTFFNDTYFNYWYKPKKSYHKFYPRTGFLKLVKLEQKPTILGKFVPFRLFFTKVLNIPLIFSLIFTLEVKK